MSVDNNIPNGWVETTLGEVCQNISRKFNFNSKEEVVFINTGDVLSGKFLHKDYSSKIGLPGQAKKGILQGDILYSEIRPKNKRFAIVDFDAKDYVVSTKFMVISKNPALINNEFLYVFLSSEKKINEFNIIAESRSGTFPQITFDAISYLNVLLPPLPEQTAIAKILTAFDDKIELLQAQNKTLETTAQTIFKEWFGKYQIGDELPDGWRVGKLGEVIDIVIDNRGKTPPLVEKGIPLIEVNSITGNSRNINIGLSKKYVDNDTYQNWFRKGHPINSDVLISTVGSIGQLGQVFDEKICIAQNVVALRNKTSGNFLYGLLKRNQKLIINLDISSVQPSIKVPHLLNLPVIIPHNDFIIKYDNISNSITSKIFNNSTQIQALKQTRDTLLPKLMSGALRVNEFKESAV